MTKFEYSVLRAVPNKRRGEIVNIGLVIYRQDLTDVRILPIFSKVKALDPNIDIIFLKNLPETIKNFLSTDSLVEDRMKALKELGIIDVSDLGWFESGEDNYESNVEKLLEKLVYVPTRERRPRIPQSKLMNELKKEFSHYSILGKNPSDAQKHKIVNHYPIVEAERLYADFAIRNGVWNITELLDFRGSIETLRSNNKLQQTAFKAITLDRSRKVLGKDSIPYVVYSVDPEMEELIQPHIKILNHYADKIFNFSDQQERKEYVNFMRKAAGKSGIFAEET